jgi:threonyl-tRNA synthetase
MQSLGGKVQKSEGSQQNQPDRPEIKERLDHIELGEKLGLFFFDDVTPGSCFFLPHGAVILNRLIDFVRELYSKEGYSEVNTPVICDKRLWVTSGHCQKFKDNMFTILNNINDAYEFSLCPMNCPKHTLIYKKMNPSYRDLPIRLADFGPLHRNESSGSLRGLTRVRLFHQDDAHIFCRRDQIERELKSVIGMMKFVYSTFKLEYEFTISTRPEQHIGSIELWDLAESILKDCLKSEGKPFNIDEGSGAFYGPKIDVIVCDSVGRKHQLGTIQLDFNLPARFELKYTTESLEERYATPIMIHRAIFGSLERFIAILLEHTQGHLPLWLSPRQISILPVSQKHAEYAGKLKERIRVAHKVCIDLHVDGTISKRVRHCEVMKYCMILVVGNKEMAMDTVTVRLGSATKITKVDDFLNDLKSSLQIS